MRLFSDNGYQAVTIRSIADALGWSPMKSYRYFENKLAIFVAVRDMAFTELAKALKAAADSADGPMEKIYESGYAYVRFALHRPHEYNLCFATDQQNMPEFQLMSDAAVSPWDLTVENVSRAKDAGLISGDPVLVSHLSWIGLHGLVTLHNARRLNFGRSVEDLVDPLIDSILAGFLTAKGRRERRRSSGALRELRTTTTNGAC